MSRSSRREQLAKKYAEIAKEVPIDLKLPEKDFEEKVVQLKGSEIVKQLLLRSEEWFDERFGKFQCKTVAVCDGEPKCSACSRTLQNNELCYLLKPSYRFVCLNCTRPASLTGLPMPRSSFWETASLVWIRRR